MAKFQSQVYTAIRGSVGGITYTKNQFAGLIAKARVAPTNPRTSNQTLIRSAFAAAAQMWIDATATQRAGWNAYADSLEYHGPLGTYKLPGRQVFLGNIAAANYYNIRGLSVAAVTAAPPLVTGFLELDNVHEIPLVAVGTGISVSATVLGTEDIVAALEVSPNFNPTRERFGGPFISSSLDEIDFDPAPMSGFLDFLGLIEDAAYFVRIRAISKEPPFRMSPYYIVRSVATTVVV